MDKLKERWEFIVGYVALIVSLSSFKDELDKIELDLGFTIFTASKFLFVLIICFFFALHLYLIPFLFSSSKYADKKIFRYLEKSSYFIFVLLSLSPFFVCFSVLIYYLINLFNNITPETKSTINSAAMIIIGIVLGAFSNIIAKKYILQKYSTQKQELEFEEIREFENAQKLFSSGYYSQSILEAFKVLELHLRRLIVQKDIPFRSNKFQDLLDMAIKIDVISKKDWATINDIRKMRNSAAHLDVDFTRAQANDAINFIKQLIRNTTTTNSNAT